MGGTPLHNLSEPGNAREIGEIYDIEQNEGCRGTPLHNLSEPRWFWGHGWLKRIQNAYEMKEMAKTYDE